MKVRGDSGVVLASPASQRVSVFGLWEEIAGEWMAGGWWSWCKLTLGLNGKIY